MKFPVTQKTTRDSIVPSNTYTELEEVRRGKALFQDQIQGFLEAQEHGGRTLIKTRSPDASTFDLSVEHQGNPGLLVNTMEGVLPMTQCALVVKRF